jgi:hypothetical protein
MSFGLRRQSLGGSVDDPQRRLPGFGGIFRLQRFELTVSGVEPKPP